MPETPEQRIVRQGDEEEDIVTDPAFSTEGAGQFKKYLREKHEIEVTTGEILPNDINTQRYLEHAESGEIPLQPDPDGKLARGSYVADGLTFVGVDEEGYSVLRAKKTMTDGSESIEETTIALTPAELREAIEEGAEIKVIENSSRQKSVPPDPAIEAVSVHEVMTQKEQRTERVKNIVPPLTDYMRRVGRFVGKNEAKLDEVPTDSLQDAYETAIDPAQKEWTKKILAGRGIDAEKVSKEKITNRKAQKEAEAPTTSTAPMVAKEETPGKKRFNERIEEAVTAIQNGYGDTVPESFRAFPEVKAALEAAASGTPEPWPWPKSAEVVQPSVPTAEQKFVSDENTTVEPWPWPKSPDVVSAVSPDQKEPSQAPEEVPPAPEPAPQSSTGAPELSTEEELDETGKQWMSFIQRNEEHVTAAPAVTELKPEGPTTQVPAVESQSTGVETNGVESVPLTENNWFDPKSELERIKRAPTAERGQLLTEYKEKLNAQKKGIAALQEAVIAEIRKNEQLTQEEFLRIAKPFIETYRLSPDQQATINERFNDYRGRNDAIREARKNFPDDNAFFEAAFGRKPEGKVEVLTTPFMVYFRCNDPKDYALIRTGKGYFGGEVTEGDVHRTSTSGGISGCIARIPKISGLIAAENVKGRTPGEEELQKIMVHEEQHLINKILLRRNEELLKVDSELRVREAFEEYKRLSAQLADVGKEENATLESLLTQSRERLFLANINYARSERRRIADKKVRDEILAYIKEGQENSLLQAILTRTQNENSSYDYLYDERNGLPKISPVDLPEIRPIFEKLIEDRRRVYTQEYEDLIKTGLESYERLEKAGYSGEAIRSIFQTEELIRWKKVTDRLIGKEDVISGPENNEVLTPEEIGLEISKLQSMGEVRSREQEKRLAALLKLQEIKDGKETTTETLVAETSVTKELLAKETGALSLTPEQFAKIPEFNALTEGKQLLVLRELNKYLVANVKGEAVKEYYEKLRGMNAYSEADKKFADASNWKPLRMMAAGILRARNIAKTAGMALFKDKWLADKEKEIAADIEKGEVNVEEYVKTLSEMYGAEGPDAAVKDGKLRLQFVSEAELGGEESPLPRADIARIEKFNTVAAKFMETPHSWREHGASERDRAAYAEIKGEYTNALNDILELRRLRGGDERALRDTLDVERAVTLSQFFNTYPDTETEFASIKDQSSWGRWALSAARIRTRAFAVGGATRAVAAGVLGGVAGAATGLIAAPLAGGVVGGIAGRRNAVRELEEQEMMEKLGGDAMTDEEKKKRDDVGGKLALVLQKVREGNADPALLAERDELQKEYDRLDKGRNIVPADALVGKITRLNERISALEGAEEDIKQIVGEKAGAAPTTEELADIITRHGLASSGDSWTPETLSLEAITTKRKELAESLEARYWYTKEKIEKGLVDFGALESGLKNKYALLKALGEACATAEVEQHWDGKLKDELRKFIDYKEGAIDKRQAEFKDRKMMQGVKYGVVFGAAGGAVADVIHYGISGGGVTGTILGANEYVSDGVDIFQPEEGSGIERDIITPPQGGGSADGVDIVSPEVTHGGAATEAAVVPGGATEMLLGKHAVVPGDRLEWIMKDLPALKGMNDTQKLNAIYNTFSRMSAEDYRAAGISSGNKDMIIAGKDSIDLDALNRVLVERHGTGGGVSSNIGETVAEQAAPRSVGGFSYVDEPVLPEPPPGSGDILGTGEEIAGIAAGAEQHVSGNGADTVAPQSGKFTYVPEPKLPEPPPGSGDILGTAEEVGKIGVGISQAPTPLTSTEIITMIGRYESGIGRAMTTGELQTIREMIQYEASAVNDPASLKDVAGAREALLAAMHDKPAGLTPEDVSGILAPHKLDIIDGKMIRVHPLSVF